MHHDARLAHQVMEDRATSQFIFGHLSRQQQDGKRTKLDGWNEHAKAFNDKVSLRNWHVHVSMDDDGNDVSSPGREGGPRIDCRSVNPNHESIFTKEWTGAELKSHFTELKALLTPYLARHNVSGQNGGVMEDPADEDTSASITNFLPHPEGDWSPSGDLPQAPRGSKGRGRPRGTSLYKEKIVKYVHLLYKGDIDLLSFVCRALDKGDAREGGLSDSDDDDWETNGTRSGRRKRRRKANAAGKLLPPPPPPSVGGVTDAGLKAALSQAATADASSRKLEVVFPQYAAAAEGSVLRLCLAHTLQKLMPELILPELMQQRTPPTGDAAALSAMAANSVPSVGAGFGGFASTGVAVTNGFGLADGAASHHNALAAAGAAAVAAAAAAST
jgi:hypothetical protein